MCLALSLISEGGGEGRKLLVSTDDTSETACILGHRVQKHGPRKTECLDQAKMSALHHKETC